MSAEKSQSVPVTASVQEEATDVEEQPGEQGDGLQGDTADSCSDVTVIYSRNGISSDNTEHEAQSAFPMDESRMFQGAFDQRAGYLPGSVPPEMLAQMYEHLQTGLPTNVTANTFTGQEHLRFPLNQQDRTGPTFINIKDSVISQSDSNASNAADDAFANLHQMTKLLRKQEDSLKYVSTYAERSASRLLKQFGSRIIINGRSGTGKTRVARELLHNIAKDTKRIALEITSSRQWDLITQRVSSGQRCVVMIDDIFGSSSFVQAKFDEWQVALPSMWAFAENGFILFIITSRGEIMSECSHLTKKYKLIKDAKSITLDENEYLLRKCEKRKFLKIYCPKTNFTEEEMQQIVENQTSLGFPQCCLFFANSKEAKQRGIHYFLRPHEFLDEEISGLKGKDPLGYLVLLLILMKKGSLEMKLLNPFKVSKEFKELIENTSQACILDTVPTVEKVRKKAHELCGTYLIKSKTEFQFQHQSVYDALILNLSQEYPEVSIEISPAKVLVDLVRTQTHKKKDHEVIISLTDDCYETLATRVTEILSSEENTDILDHQCLHDQQFVQLLLQTWDGAKIQEILKHPTPPGSVETYVMVEGDGGANWLTLLRNVHAIPIKKVCLFKYDHILAYLILKDVHLITDFILGCHFEHLLPQDLAQILTCCVYKNRKETTEMLMKRNTRPVADTIRSLCATAYFDERQNNAIVSDYEQNEEDPIGLGDLQSLLSVALFSGNICMVAYLVEKMKNNSEHGRMFRTGLMQVAVQCSDVGNSGFDSNFEPRKDFDVVAATEILMNTDCGTDLDFLVNMSSGHDNPILLRYLLQKRINLNKTFGGRSPLHVAVQFGSYECVVELVEKGADVTAVTYYKDAEVYNDTHWTSVSLSSVLHFVAMSTKDKCKKLAFLLDALLKCNNKKAWRRMILAQEDLSDLMTGEEIDEAIEEAGLDLTEEELNEAIEEACLDQAAMDIQDGIPTSDHRMIVKRVDVDMKDIKKRTPLQLAAKFRSKSYFSTSAQNHQMIENCAFFEELIKQGSDHNLKDLDGYTALHYATANGNIDIVKVLIMAGARTDITDGDGSSLYHFVAGRRTYYKEEDISLQAKKSLCDIFLQAGCDINTVDRKGRSCLHEAAEHGDILMLKFLQGKGANVNVQDKEGKTVLHDAARKGDLDMIAFLCEKGTGFNIKDNEGQTVVHEAAKSTEDAVEKLQYLLSRKKGAPLNDVDYRGQTAIFPAVLSGDTEVVEYLMEKGLRLSHKDLKGNTVLHRACKYKLKNMVSFLLRHRFDVNEVNKSGRSTVYLAVKGIRYHAEPSLLKMLLDAGADTNKKGLDGNTPLHILNYRKNIFSLLSEQCLELLLEASADPNVQDATGVTPLHLAAQEKNSKCVQLLLDHGADPNIKDVDGRTALQVAVKRQLNEDCINLLVDKVLNHSQQDNDGCTLLHHMAAGGNAKSVKLLLQRGADPHVTNKQGQTALNMAKDVESLEELLSYGADPDHSDEKGMTALHALAKSKKTKSIRLLLQHRANPSLQNKEGNTPIHVICQDFGAAFFSIIRHTTAVEMVEVLKMNGCDISLRNNCRQRAFDIIGNLPLHNDAQMEASRKRLVLLLKE